MTDMATKPTSTARWAATSGASIIEPTSGAKDVGFQEGEQPTAETFNWLHKTAHLWFEYLNDGALTGNHSVAGDLAVTGNLSGWHTHGDTPLTVPASAFRVSGPAALFAAGTIPELDVSHWYFSASAAGTIVAPIQLPVGKRIKSITWNFNKAGSAAALTMRLRKRTGTTTTTIDTLADVTSGASQVQVTRTPNYAIEAGRQVWLEVQGGNVSHVFGWADIVYDQPPV